MSCHLPNLGDLSGISATIPDVVEGRPKTPDSPLWRPPPGTCIQLMRAEPHNRDVDSVPEHRDTVRAVPNHTRPTRTSSPPAPPRPPEEHEAVVPKEGVAVPRTGVRRALLEPMHHGDRTFADENAPLQQSELPLQTVNTLHQHRLL